MSTTDVSLSNFESVIGKPGIVMIDAWAAWCGPCRAFGPVFEAASQRHPEVVWAKLDTEQQGELAGAFNIRSIPTLLVFRDGVLLLQQAGMLPGKALDELVSKAAALDMDEVRSKIAEQERTRDQLGQTG